MMNIGGNSFQVSGGGSAKSRVKKFHSEYIYFGQNETDIDISIPNDFDIKKTIIIPIRFVFSSVQGTKNASNYMVAVQEINEINRTVKLSRLLGGSMFLYGDVMFLELSGCEDIEFTRYTNVNQDSMIIYVSHEKDKKTDIILTYETASTGGIESIGNTQRIYDIGEFSNSYYFDCEDTNSKNIGVQKIRWK